MPKPSFDSFPSFYHNYVRLVEQDELKEGFDAHVNNLVPMLQDLPHEKWNHSYAEGKWTIKELVQHIIDTDRIFCYRALTFARKDNIALPGFDENNYAQASKANNRKSDDLLEELALVQKSTTKLFLSFDEEQLNAVGTANGNPISVRAVGFIVIGHTLHHKNILNERYL